MAEDDLELRDVAGPCINILEAAIGPTKHGQVGTALPLIYHQTNQTFAQQVRWA